MKIMNAINQYFFGCDFDEMAFSDIAIYYGSQVFSILMLIIVMCVVKF